MEKNELDELLKHHMKMSDTEIPEPDPAIHNMLRNKIQKKELLTKKENSLFEYLYRLLTIEIKLYQAALAVSVIVLFFMFKPIMVSQNKPDKKDMLSMDSTINSSSVKQNRFLVRNFTGGIN